MNKHKPLTFLPLISLAFVSCTSSNVSSEIEASSDYASSSEEESVVSSETSVDSEQAFIDSLEWKYDSAYHYKENNGQILQKKPHSHPETGTYTYYVRVGCEVCDYTSIDTGPAFKERKDKSFTSFDELSSFLDGDYAKNDNNKPFDILNVKNIVESESPSFVFHYGHYIDDIYTNSSINETFYVYDSGLSNSTSDLKYSFKVDAFFVGSDFYKTKTNEITYKVLKNEETYEIQTWYGNQIYGKVIITPNRNAASDYYLNYVKTNIITRG